MHSRILSGALAVCTAAVLSVFSMGTASASAPAAWGHGGNDIHCPTAGNCTQGGNPYTGSTSACTSFPCTLDANGVLDHDPRFGGHFGGHFLPGWGGGLGSNFFPLDNYGLNGLGLYNSNEILLADGQYVNVCQYPVYDQFVGHGFFNRLRGDWRGRLGAWNYPRIVTAACGNTVAVGNGINILNGNYLNGNLLNLNALGGVLPLGLSDPNVCSFGDWGAFDGWGSHHLGFNGHWDHVRGSFGRDPGFAFRGLRNRANCGNTVVVQPQPNIVVVPSSTPQAEAPQYTDPGSDDNTGVGAIHHAPAAAPETGDGSSLN